MLEIEHTEQRRRLNNSVMTNSKMSSGGGQGLLAGTTVADTSSTIDHRSDMINQRQDSHLHDLSPRDKPKSNLHIGKGLKHSGTLSGSPQRHALNIAEPTRQKPNLFMNSINDTNSPSGNYTRAARLYQTDLAGTDGETNSGGEKLYHHCPTPRKFSKQAVDRLSVSKKRKILGRGNQQYVPRREMQVQIPWGMPDSASSERMGGSNIFDV